MHEQIILKTIVTYQTIGSRITFQKDSLWKYVISASFFPICKLDETIHSLCKLFIFVSLG